MVREGLVLPGNLKYLSSLLERDKPSCPILFQAQCLASGLERVYRCGCEQKTNSILISRICLIFKFCCCDLWPTLLSLATIPSLPADDYLHSLTLHNIAINIFVSNHGNGMTTKIHIKLAIVSIINNHPHMTTERYGPWSIPHSLSLVLSIISTWVTLFFKVLQQESVSRA